MKLLSQSCEGKTTEGDARYTFRWTPTCYFGRPGSYADYSFMLMNVDEDKCPKLPSTFDSLDMQEMPCADGEIPVQGVFVDTAGEESNPQQHGEIVANFVYWGEM